MYIPVKFKDTMAMTAQQGSMWMIYWSNTVGQGSWSTRADFSLAIIGLIWPRLADIREAYLVGARRWLWRTGVRVIFSVYYDQGWTNWQYAKTGWAEELEDEQKSAQTS
jgi:hypothetical protein